MGIKVEFNPDLALRNYSEFEKGNRKLKECLPKEIRIGEVYEFLKKDQRNYWLEGEIPLLETKGNSVLSKPLASIVILEATHFMENGVLFTKGKYKVMEIFNDDKIHFDGFTKVNYQEIK